VRRVRRRCSNHRPSREEDNKRRRDAWERLLPGLVSGYVGSVGSAQQLTASQQLEQWWGQHVRCCLSFCGSCGAQSKVVVADGGPAVLLVSHDAHVKVIWPTVVCEQSGCVASPSPVCPTELSVFPGTPSRPEVMYTFELLNLIKHLFLSGYLAMNHLTRALHSVHRDAGCIVGGFDALWQNLGDAFDKWMRMMSDLEQRLREVGAPKGPVCPACVAGGPLAFDGCFGIRRLRKAGRASGPLENSSRVSNFFVPRNFLDDKLERSKSIVASRGHACATFAAAGASVTLSAGRYSNTGLFGGCCGCGITHVLTPIITPGEAWGHMCAVVCYLIVSGFVVQPAGTPLPDVRAVLDGTAKPRLEAAYYDIACSFEAHWKRCARLVQQPPLRCGSLFHVAAPATQVLQKPRSCLRRWQSRAPFSRRRLARQES